MKSCKLVTDDSGHRLMPFRVGYLEIPLFIKGYNKKDMIRLFLEPFIKRLSGLKSQMLEFSVGHACALSKIMFMRNYVKPNLAYYR